LRELPGLGLREKAMHLVVDVPECLVHAVKHGAHRFRPRERLPERTGSTRERSRHFRVHARDPEQQGVRALRHRQPHVRVSMLARRLMLVLKSTRHLFRHYA
jgi:hypothetical protein|tara:strand:- start:303 stop:608 length:306 start_codon:yes stop_codon:yes gene_type:complete